MILFVLTVVGTVIGALLATEASSWMPHLSCRLVRRVLAKLPDGLPQAQRDRWSEEIEADLESYRDRPLGGLFFALGLWRKGARRLAAELTLQRPLTSRAERSVGDSYTDPETSASSEQPREWVITESGRAIVALLSNEEKRLQDLIEAHGKPVSQAELLQLANEHLRETLEREIIRWRETGRKEL